MPTLSIKSSPPFNPSDFVLGIDNPYMPLQPGTTLVYETQPAGEVVTFVVTRETKVINGVTCVVVHDTSRVDGELAEDTFDYFAQDKNGNVWYFGEDTKEYEDGKVVSTEGTWRAGVDGASPGIVMEAHPQVGDAYNQENAPGVAEDKAKVLSLNAVVDTPYGDGMHALQTAETTPLEPEVLEHKFYLSGVGLASTTNVRTGEIEDLVKITFDGTNGADAINGKLGKDEINGFAGNDRLNGAGGSDLVKGGAGDDVLNGGFDDDAADLLYGGNGRDRLYLWEGDKAFGGNGNDRIRLMDGDEFSLVDGGGQDGNDVGKGRGDTLEFEGSLNLTKAGVSERIIHIESLSMVGAGHDHLKLNAQDVLDLGDGRLDPAVCGKDGWGKGDAVRISGGEGDTLTLTGGKWQEVEDVTNVPDDYDVYARQTATGVAYVMVDEDVQVNLT